MPAAETPAPAPVIPAPAPVIPAPAAPMANAPVISESPVSAAPAANYNNGISTPYSGDFPAAPTVPEAPSFVPSGSGAVPAVGGGDINGLNGAAAAVAAAPAKKKKHAGKIVLIIVIVLVVLLGAAAAFFFTNKATALSLVMGKPKYAAMIEKESLKKAAEKLDMDVVSDQIKSFSSIMSTLSNADINPANPFPTLDLGNKVSADPEFAKLMSVSAAEGVDVKAMLKGYSEYMQSIYGAGRISGSMSANINLDASLSDEEIDKALKLINGAEITYDFAATDKLMGAEYGITINNNPLNARVIIEEDGSAYIALPFASDKALKYKIATVENTAAAETSAVLDLDSNEITRLVDEVVEIYSGYIKESSVTMEKGSLNVAGINVEGKQITADINGKNLENLFKEVFEHIANDSYFCGKIVDYIKNFDPSFTESDYKNAITDLVSNMSGTTEDQKLIVTTIVTNSGDVLAKSYAISSRGEQIGSIGFADNDSASAFDVKAGEQSLFTVNTAKSGEKDGRTTIKFGIDDQNSIAVIVEYSGKDKADFGKTKIPVGTYKISIDTTEMNGIKAEEAEILNGSGLNFSASVEGSTAKYTVGLNVKNNIDLTVNANMTISDDVSKFSAPSDVIDLTPIINGEQPDEATMQQIQDYAMDVVNGLSDVFEGTELEDVISDIINGSGTGPIVPVDPIDPVIPDDPVTPNKPTTPNTPTTPGNNTYDNIDDLQERVFNEMMEVYEWYNEYEVYSGDAYDNAFKYQEKLRELNNQLWDADLNYTQKELDAFNKEFSKLIKQKEPLKKAIEAASKKNNNSNTSGSTSDTNTSAPNTSGSTSNTSAPNTSGSTGNSGASSSSGASSVPSSKPAGSSAANTSRTTHQTSAA